MTTTEVLLSQSVFRYTADHPSASLSGTDELTFPAPLDGLRFSVRRLFGA